MRRSSLIWTSIHLLSVILLAAFFRLQKPRRQPPILGSAVYLDPAQPVNVRVDDLVSRMTLEEKASQLVNQSRAIPRLQVPEYDWWSEALHGVARAGTATVFPEPIGLAATFDAPLIHLMATALARKPEPSTIRPSAQEGGTSTKVWISGRPISISSAIRAGDAGRKPTAKIRILTGRMGVAFVTGLQGDDPKYFQVDRDAQAFRRSQRPGALAAFG